MANWRNLCKAALLADGQIDEREVNIIRMLFEAIRNVILRDGSIDAAEAAWLRSWIFADGKVDADEKHWLKELKLLADKVSPEFMALYNECMAS